MSPANSLKDPGIAPSTTGTGVAHSGSQAGAPTAQARAHLRSILDKAIAWLLARIAPDGTPAFADEHHGYYRLPWTLAFVGQRESAAAVMAWIERNTLTDDGDLRDGIPRQAWTTGAATYPLSIIAQGAWVTERYGTAIAVMETLRTKFQHASTGGAFWERPEARTTGYQVAFPTAQLGLTALTTGQTDMADAAFAWYHRLLDSQPELPTRLYPIWGPQGLVTDPPDDLRFNGVVDFSKPLQAFHNPGIGAAFLARYASRTNTTEAHDMARNLLTLNRTATPEQYNHRESTSVCKFGWGAAMLLDLDPEAQLVADVVRMTQWYADSQNSDGSWVHRTPSRPNPTEAHIMEKTVEHAQWVAMMLSSLARYDACQGAGRDATR